MQECRSATFDIKISVYFFVYYPLDTKKWDMKDLYDIVISHMFPTKQNKNIYT